MKGSRKRDLIYAPILHCLPYFDCGQSIENASNIGRSKSCNLHLDLDMSKLPLEMTAIFGSWWGGVAFLFRWEVPHKRH